MTDDEREIRRKLRVLEYAELSGGVSKTWRYYGVGRAHFYPWRHGHQTHAEPGLANNRPVPQHHLGALRIVWYLERYHGIRISDAGVYSVLCRNGLNRLPRGARVRKVHTKRYNKQVPGQAPLARRGQGHPACLYEAEFAAVEWKGRVVARLRRAGILSATQLQR